MNRIKDDIDHRLRQYFDDNKVADGTKANHASIVSNLTNAIGSTTGSKPVIMPHGSSVNGFGFDGCTLDMTISDGPDTVQDLGSVLKSIPGIKVVKVDSNTFIPIVKFEYKLKNMWFNCEMSINNDLAIASSELLLTYSRIDPVVPILGSMIKEWAKNRYIYGNPYPDGYVWVLIVIHYLQQVGVLPRLQDIEPLGHNFVNGCNVYFFKDIEFLDKYFVVNNDHSLTKLLINLVNYFGRRFDYRNPVRVRKLFKSWATFDGDRLKVVDPFRIIKGRNTTYHLTYHQTVHVKDAFNEARKKLSSRKVNWRERFNGKEIIDYMSS